MQDHIKNQLTGDGTVTQGFTKRNKRGYFLTELLPMDSLKAMKALIPFSIFSQRWVSLKYSVWIFLSRIFFQMFFRGFSFEYSFADFLTNIFSRTFSLKKILRGFSFENFFSDFLSNILSRIFFQIYFHGFYFEYCFADFISNILSRILFRIFFRL